MALISLNWVEYVVKKDHLALESEVLVDRSTSVEFLSICETLLISASSSPALYPLAMNLSFNMLDWA